MQIRITVKNVEQASAELKGLVRRVRDMRPVLSEFGVHMIRSIQKTFDAGGRPDPWPPSIRVLKHGGKTLIRHGNLKNSFVRTVLDGHTVQIGTNAKYAAVHELGFDGSVQFPEHIRRVTKAFGRNLPTPTYATVRAHPHHLRIPRRSFLMVQDEDMKILKGMLEEHIIKESK